MKRTLSLAATVLLFTTIAFAAKTELAPVTVDFKTILPGPPAAGSDAAKQDIDHLLALQTSRTDAEVKRANSEVKMTPFIYSGILGPKFNPDDLPETAKFLKAIIVATAATTTEAKNFYGRKRPYLADPRIHPCVPPENTPSYPSGHSTRATVWAIVLSELYPDQKDALMARSRQIGDDRELGGVHYPSDVEAGRLLGAALAKQLLADPDVQADLVKVKAEIAGK
jgi:acid phosphatase (class A)